MRAVETARLLLLAHLEPVLEQDHARVHHRLLPQRHHVQELLDQFLRGEAHDALHAGAVVPAAVEDDDLAGRRQVRQVALHVHLSLLAVGGRGQRNRPEDPRADALGDGLDRAALAGAVAALEDDADLQALVLDPLLQLDQLAVQLRELLGVGLARQLLFRRCGVRRRVTRPAATAASAASPFLPFLRLLAVVLLLALRVLRGRVRRARGLPPVVDAGDVLVVLLVLLVFLPGLVFFHDRRSSAAEVVLTGTGCTACCRS